MAGEKPGAARQAYLGLYGSFAVLRMTPLQTQSAVADPQDDPFKKTRPFPAHKTHPCEKTRPFKHITLSSHATHSELKLRLHASPQVAIGGELLVLAQDFGVGLRDGDAEEFVIGVQPEVPIRAFGLEEEMAEVLGSAIQRGVIVTLEFEEDLGRRCGDGE